MYCKSCGKPLEPGQQQCPSCGRPTDLLSGGNGFWELTKDHGAPTAPAAPAVPAARPAAPKPEAGFSAAPPAPPVAPAPAKKGGIHPLALLGAVLALAALILSIVALSKLGALQKELRELKESIQTAEQVPSMPDTVPDPEPSGSEQPPAKDLLPTDGTEPVVPADTAPPMDARRWAWDPEAPLPYEALVENERLWVRITEQLPGEADLTWYIVRDDTVESARAYHEDPKNVPEPFESESEDRQRQMVRYRVLSGDEVFFQAAGEDNKETYRKRIYAVVTYEGNTYYTDLIDPLNALVQTRRNGDSLQADVSQLEALLPGRDLAYTWERRQTLNWTKETGQLENGYYCSLTDKEEGTFRFTAAITLDGKEYILARIEMDVIVD